MNTLTSLKQTLLCITKPVPCKQTSPALYPTTIREPYSHTTTWKLRAKAKGFGGAEDSMQDQQQSIRKQTVPRKSFRRESSDNGDVDGKISDVVFDRMMTRILFNVGFPLLTGIAFLQVFNIVKELHLWDVPIWLPFLTTFLTFGASSLGIAYGTLSTSWDPEKEGSLFGFKEAQRNWVEMWREEDGSTNE